MELERPRDGVLRPSAGNAGSHLVVRGMLQTGSTSSDAAVASHRVGFAIFSETQAIVETESGTATSVPEVAEPKPKRVVISGPKRHDSIDFDGRFVYH